MSKENIVSTWQNIIYGFLQGVLSEWVSEVLCLQQYSSNMLAIKSFIASVLGTKPGSKRDKKHYPILPATRHLKHLMECHIHIKHTNIYKTSI